MKRGHRTHCGIVLCLFGVLTTAAARGELKPLETIRRGVGASSSLVVPDLPALRAIAHSRGISALRRDLRVGLFKQVEAMSLEHLRVLSNAAGRVTTEAKAGDWVVQRAPGRGIPAQDRAIIASLLLQTDLLEAALEQRDPGRLETLKKARNKPFVRRKEDPIFGDLRDHLFSFCMNELQVTAELQAALGAGSAGDWYKPLRARTSKEAEACLLEGVTRLAQRARRIP